MAFPKPSRLKLIGIICIFLTLFRTASAFPLEAFASCLSGPCQNDAVCEDTFRDHICYCPSALITPLNKNCDEANPLCHLSTCKNNTTCMKATEDSIDLICQCTPNDTREVCERSVQKCADSLCESGTHCQQRPVTDEFAGYRCICKDGYIGTHCETEVDECASSPCQNRAVCRDRVNGYSCYCVPGFQGKHCEIEVNECASQPCQNGATCLNKIGKYVCICMPGYTGTSCELEINECQSEPCFNRARCHDYQDGYSCTCTPGFQGDLCEINIDDCRSQPCQNGAQCVDEVNGYSCECSKTGFMGLHCEIPVPLCMSKPCLNNASCEEDHGNYKCFCWPGFSGTNCELDLKECDSDPCLSGGECFEFSWKELYGTIPELPVLFDYQHAAGFVCRCQQGFKGVLCQEDINECIMNPCQNGAKCENTVGSYVCHCLQQSLEGPLYGGQNCTDILMGCENHDCQNEATCIPFLKNEQHEYSCVCPNGYAGSKCEIPTTFSFEENGYFYIGTNLQKDSINITLSFKTVLPNTLLFYQGNEDTVIQLELVNGLLHFIIHKANELSSSLELPHNVTDGEWHTVEATLGGRMFGIVLSDRSCIRDCEQKVTLEILHYQHESAFWNRSIGGLKEEGKKPGTIDAIHSQPYFIGCLQDVYVDSQLVVPSSISNATAVNVIPGCSSKDRCVANPCQNRGRCINLWQNYHCECYRPYEGQNCSNEYVTARFGSDNSEGYALFTIDDSPGQNITISMFVRTRRYTGLLLVLTNSTSHYLRIWLENGKVNVRVNDFETLSGDRFISDGHLHLLSIKIEQNQMALYQSVQKLNYTSIHTVNVQLGDLVYVGGLADKRIPASFGGYFKGCIQDLRINTKRLEFYPIGIPLSSYRITSLVNVTRGCSGDNVCDTNPCQNGGVCYAMWDDFTCTCPPSTAGRTCEEVQWCELSPCPAEAVCQSRLKGFECICNVTFRDDSSALSYKGNGKIFRDLTNITFSLRTRKHEAVILHAEKGPEFVTISIQDSHLLFELVSGNSFLTLSMKSKMPINDGQWHKVMFSMLTPKSESSEWVMVLDNTEEPSSTNVAAGNLNFLKEETNIFVGSLGPDMGGNLAGCLSTIEISSISLSYFGNTETHLPRYQQEQFIKTSAKPAILGCSGANVCAPSPCLNGGSCKDLFNDYNCTCPPGWTGLKCEINIDNCASNPCIHGNCTDRTLAYECKCDPGYTGKNCELEIDECKNHQCGNGATCLDGINRYFCLCPQNATGSQCDVKIEKVSWYLPETRMYPLPEATSVPVVRIYPMLPVSICRNSRRNYTCFNGGNCTDAGESSRCNCQSGFAGDWCEIDVDECKSNPCLNGGFCRNMLNSYQCICNVSYAGERCEVDLNTDSMTSELLLSICLVSVALLLALFLATTAFIVAMNRRATHGTYSPSRQEKEGSRLEMWNMVQPPPMERLI
ncbi:protein crumbs homolog 1 isoform X1 [Lepisosteus oculatus]|uniref:protein crumbs homolog 1 isoform X1 n=1 Tax=Lepisosteus oculatus TaxID=7918 RepID=UPI003714D32B